MLIAYQIKHLLQKTARRKAFIMGIPLHKIEIVTENTPRPAQSRTQVPIFISHPRETPPLLSPIRSMLARKKLLQDHSSGTTYSGYPCPASEDRDERRVSVKSVRWRSRYLYPFGGCILKAWSMVDTRALVVSLKLCSV